MHIRIFIVLFMWILGNDFTARPLGLYPTPPARPRARRLTTAGGAGFLDGFLHRFTGFARAFLNPPNQFFLLAFDVLQIVIRQLGPFLFQLAFGDIPVAFDFKCSHND
jgi:hypothetical protein